MSLSSGQQFERMRHDDSGFTLVEVVVAVFILAVVVGAATLAVSTSSRATQNVKVVDRQRSIASGALNRVLSNRDWIKTYACGTGTCDITAFIPVNDPLLRESESTVQHRLAITATGVDLANDTDITGRDADRQSPDVYRISVTVATTVPADAAPVRDYTATGSLNVATRATTGVLRLRSCEVRTQIDERIGLGLCTRTSTQTIPISPPGGSASYCMAPPASNSPECLTWSRATAITSPIATMAQEMTVSPIPVWFTLTGPMNERSPSSQTFSTSATGGAEIANLAPGRYTLQANASSLGRRELWSSHSVPSGGEVTIRAGEVNDAVQMFRPLAATVTIRLETENTTDPIAPRVTAGAWVPRAIKLIPVPNGRSALANGIDRGWTKILKYNPPNVTATSVTINDVGTGLYQIQLIEYPGAQRDILYNPSTQFLWVPPASGGTQYPSNLVIRDFRCDTVERRDLMAARITPLQVSLGMANRGFVYVNPDDGKEYWHGPCTGDNLDSSNVQTTGDASA